MSEFGFTVDATFQEVPISPAEGWVKTDTDRGILLACDLPALPSPVGEPPRVTLDFLRSDFGMLHSDILQRTGNPYSTTYQPSFTYEASARERYTFAGRYTLWRTLGQLEIGLMLTRHGGDVTLGRRYTVLRRTLALACGQAVLAQAALAQSKPPNVLLQISNNYDKPRSMTADSFTASSLEDLYAQLGGI